MITETYHEDGKVGVFYSNDSLDGALVAAKEHSKDGGVVASLPWLFRLRAGQQRTHWSWQTFLNTMSEEIVFSDVDGEFDGKFCGTDYSRGEDIVAVIHGISFGQLLGLKRDGNTYSMPYEKLATACILDWIPHDSVYHIDEVLKETPPHKFPLVVLAPLKKWKTLKSDRHTKDEFVNSEIVIARTLASQQERENYFTTSLKKGNTLGNHNNFQKGKGHLLFLTNSYYGLDGGSNLGNIGRFVGVSPEAPQRAREWIAEQQIPLARELWMRNREPGRRQQRPTAIFVPGQGYFASENVPNKEPEQREGENVYSGLLANVQQEFPQLSAAEQEEFADIVTRRKSMEILDDKKDKPQGLTDAQKEALRDIDTRFKGLELD